MKKTLVALAALAATSAFAQTTVTLSGRGSVDVSTYQATGSTAGAASDYRNRFRVADSSSRIAFGVNEDLGGGLKAGVYCETGLNIDNASSTGQADSNNPNTTSWCSREGRVYFGNQTVEVRLGRQNVWWTQGALNEVGSTFLGSDTFTNLQNGGVGVYTTRGENMVKLAAGGGAGAFAGSEIYYGLMGVSGFSGATNAAGEAATPKSNTTNGKYFGSKLVYTSGKIVAMWDHQNSTGSPATPTTPAPTANTGVVSTNSFNRSSNKFGVGFKYTPTSMISAQYWIKKRVDPTGAAATIPFSTGATVANTTTTGSVNDAGYGFVVKHDLGNTWMLHGQWGKAKALKDDAGNTGADTGATAYTLGATKSFSKRTHVYTAYHVIKNQTNAAYNMSAGNYASAGTLYTGADVKMYSLGMIHNF